MKIHDAVYSDPETMGGTPVFVTMDKNIPHQQNVAELPFGVSSREDT